MSAIRVVCAIGVPRTGSTRVVSLLSAFDRLYVRGEIFHPWAVHTLEEECSALAAFLGLDTSDIRDAKLVERVRARSQDVIDWLLARAGDHAFVLKLFPDHLDAQQLKLLFARTDAAFVFVRRRPIDCYISELKARKIGKWKSVDTTGVKVLGDARHLMRQCAQQRLWYGACRWLAAQNARPAVDVSYERELARPDALSLMALQTKLRLLGVDPGAPRLEQLNRLVRQDLNQNYEAKMVNWQQFDRELRGLPDHEAAFVE